MLKGANFVPFSASEIADGRDRALANRLVTTALQAPGPSRQRLLAYLLERGLPKKSGGFEAVLRLSLAQLLYLPELGDHRRCFSPARRSSATRKTQHLGRLMNAVLRRAQAEADKLRAAPPELLFPDCLVGHWRSAYGDAALPDFAQALLEGAPLDLTLRETIPTWSRRWARRRSSADTVRVDGARQAGR